MSVRICEKNYDAIVIGTGIGGSVAGYTLAKAGKKVLFCEKGRSFLERNDYLSGNFAETFIDSKNALNYHEIYARAGRYSEKIKDISGKKIKYFVPFLGQGSGGSSALYGMAMERMFPEDFSPKKYYRENKESSLPEHWPIKYEELKPYYQKAEKLFYVKPINYLNAVSGEFFDFFAMKGFHPRKLPLARKHENKCEPICQGFLCGGDCKNDSAKICLGPAIKQFGADFLDECEVVNLESNESRVTKIIVRHEEKCLSFNAPIVILAAGALETPRILLNSASRLWPKGLANNSGMVGKNLMRHFIDLYAIVPKTIYDRRSVKEIALDDFYITEDGEKFGTFQSFGPLFPPLILAKEIENKIIRKGNAIGGVLSEILLPFVKIFSRFFLSKSIIFASILEDLPYPDNSVLVSGGKLSIKYTIKKYDAQRIKKFREIIGKILKPYRFIRIKQAENNNMIAHICGTCRFGTDKENSVLNRDNKAHDLENLFIVDSSFFPSSSGTNPALTIAANALRVADHIIKII